MNVLKTIHGSLKTAGLKMAGIVGRAAFFTSEDEVGSPAGLDYDDASKTFRFFQADPATDKFKVKIKPSTTMSLGKVFIGDETDPKRSEQFELKQGNARIQSNYVHLGMPYDGGSKGVGVAIQDSMQMLSIYGNPAMFFAGQFIAAAAAPIVNIETKPVGVVILGAGQTVLTVQNCYGKIVFITPQNHDATATSFSVEMQDDYNFTITANAPATADVKIAFFVING